MKHNLFKSIIVCVGALTIVSCWETNEDDLEVYFPSNKSGGNTNSNISLIRKANNTIDKAWSEVKESSLNPDNIVPESLLPDGFIDLPSGNSMGYVDLGLTHKWAVSNLKCHEFADRGVVKSFEEYISLPSFERIEASSESSDGGYTVMSYKDYIKGGKSNTNKEIDVDTYLAQAEQYCRAIVNNKNYYFDYLWNQKYGFLWDSNGTVVDSMDEWADFSWGSQWATPSENDLKELLEKCTVKMATFRNVTGVIMTGPSGKAIFLPFHFNHSELGKIGIYISMQHNNEGNPLCLLLGEPTEENPTKLNGGLGYFRTSSYSLRPILK